MRDDDDIIKGSGGGGGSSGDFTQTPDNLRSEDRFEGLLALGQGRWKGLVKGLESLKVEGTPFDDGNGKSNFKDWRVVLADGDPASHPQKPELVLGSAASPVNIGVALGNTSGTGTPVVRTVNNTGAAFIDLRFIVSQLYRQDKKGIFNNTMHIRVRMKPTGNANWIDVLIDGTATESPWAQGGTPFAGGLFGFLSRNWFTSDGSARVNTGIVSGQLTITGKTTQPYVKEVRIAVPNTGNYANKSWDIECTLMDLESVDNDPNFEKRQVTWESAAAVYTKALGGTEAWRGLVWLTMLGTSSDRINGIPQIYGEYDTKIVNVPPSNVYNPDTRQYSGVVWDGSWIKAYTNDPAWVINDAIMDPLAGVSATAAGSYLNKWDALELSKYCSELVRNGDAPLITNGNGDTLTGWTASAEATASLVGGRIRVTRSSAGAVGARISQNITTVVGKTYAVRATATRGTGDAHVYVGTTLGNPNLVDLPQVSAGTSQIGGSFTASSTTSILQLEVNSATVGAYAEFDFVEVTETHPRFSLNVVIDQPQKADEFIQNLAGAVSARAWDNGGGEWRCKVDKLETPVAIFTEENIVGEFSYSHTDVDTRYNDITLVFLNAEFDYREDRVRVYDQTNIDQVGRKTTTIVALGCTNRQEAYRRAMLRLRSSINEWRLVTFTTNRQGRFLEPLQTILVADKSLGYTPPTGSTAYPDTDDRNHTTGRLTGWDVTRKILTLRDPLRIEPGASYEIQLTVPNPNYNPDAATAPNATPDWDKPTVVITRTVDVGTPRGDVWTLGITTALPADTPVNAPIALKATGLPTTPVTYRVVSITGGEDRETVNVVAAVVDTGKWAAADAVSSSEIDAQVPSQTCPSPIAPGTGVFNLRTFVSEYSFNRVLEVDWVRPASTFISGYEVRLRHNDSPSQVFTTTELRVELQNPEFGIYDVEIYAIDRRGGKSQPLTATTEVTEQSQLRAQGYLTNESHTLGADSAGNVGSYTGANGQFRMFIGTVDVTAGCTFAITANPQALTGPYAGGSPVNSVTGDYSVTGGFDAGESSATLTMTATHTASGYTFVKTFSLAKSIAGNAASAKTMLLATSHYTFVYGDGGTVPQTQTTTLTATRINPGAATTLWSLYKGDGTVIVTGQTAAQLQTLGYATAVTNDQITINQTQYDNLVDAQATNSILVRALYSDNASLFDQVSLVTLRFGDSSLSAYLTRPAVVVTVLADGSGGDFTNAGGAIKVFRGGLDVTASCTFAVFARTGGLDAGNSSVGATTGVYTVTGCSADQGGMTLRVTYASQTLDLNYSLAKVRPNAVITLKANPAAFYFVDGVAVDTAQSVTINATKQGTNESLNWSSSPAVTLTGTGDSRSLSLANFGTNTEVVITATGSVTGATASLSIRRVDQTTPGDSVIPDTDFDRSSILSTGTPWSRTGTFGRVARYL